MRSGKEESSCGGPLSSEVVSQPFYCGVLWIFRLTVLDLNGRIFGYTRRFGDGLDVAKSHCLKLLPNQLEIVHELSYRIR